MLDDAGMMFADVASSQHDWTLASSRQEGCHQGGLLVCKPFGETLNFYRIEPEPSRADFVTTKITVRNVLVNGVPMYLKVFGNFIGGKQPILRQFRKRNR